MTYSKHEALVLIPIEYELMKKLGVDRSELHKTAIKEFYNRRQQSHWTWFEDDMAKTIKISDVHHSMLVDIGKRRRMKPEDLIEELIQETYSSKSKKKWKEH